MDTYFKNIGWDQWCGNGQEQQKKTIKSIILFDKKYSPKKKYYFEQNKIIVFTLNLFHGIDSWCFFVHFKCHVQSHLIWSQIDKASYIRIHKDADAEKNISNNLYGESSQAIR